jgi:hypothetical protein
MDQPSVTTDLVCPRHIPFALISIIDNLSQSELCVGRSVTYGSFPKGLAVSCLRVRVGDAISISMPRATSCSEACGLLSSLCKADD